MYEGWICLHRKIRQNPVFYDADLLRLWLYCLLEATHRERDQLIGRQVVKLLPGEFVTGRFDLEAGFNNGLKPDRKKSPKTIWRWLETLESAGFLTIKSTTKFSVISIVNWHLYQDKSSDDDQQVTNKRPTDDQQMTNKRPTDDQQVTTNNNVNNINNNKQEKIKRLSRQREAYAEDSSPYRLAVYLLSKINSWTDKLKEPDLQSWADDCRKLLEIDKRDKQLIRDVIDWVTENSFWRTNILSPSKLRKQFDRLVIEMESAKKPRLVYSRGDEPNERHERAGTNSAVGAEHDLDIFVRR